MFELPLFPHDRVLFPGFPIQVRFSETHYIEMISRCAAQKKTFGVALIREEMGAGGPLPVPHRVGCTAHILRAFHSSDGFMYLLAKGEERFRIRSLNLAHPYLVGQVDLLPLQQPCSLEMQRGAKQLRLWLRRYVELYGRVDAEFQSSMRDLLLPEDPLQLAYLSATLLQLPELEKQPLLEAHSGYALLSGVLRLLRREAALLTHARGGKNAALN